MDQDKETIASAKKLLAARGADPERVSTETVGDFLARKPPADNVISMDCLEHVQDDRALFDSLFHAVRPQGRIVVTVPALMAVYGEKDRQIGHYRRYERATLLQLTKGYPITVKELRFWNFLGVVPTYLSQRLLHRSVDESFRYDTRPSALRRTLRKSLDLWFSLLENPVPFPLGLTLVMTMTREK